MEALPITPSSPTTGPGTRTDWSPDGTRIFTRMVWLCDRCDQEEIFSTNVDGSDIRWLTTDTRFASARSSWSPDGKRIVAETSSGIAILDLAGKPLQIVNKRGTEPAWQPCGRAEPSGPARITTTRARPAAQNDDSFPSRPGPPRYAARGRRRERCLPVGRESLGALVAGRADGVEVWPRRSSCTGIAAKQADLPGQRSPRTAASRPRSIARPVTSSASSTRESSLRVVACAVRTSTTGSSSSRSSTAWLLWIAMRRPSGDQTGISTSPP